jgi:hypothetical protein
MDGHNAASHFTANGLPLHMLTACDYTIGLCTVIVTVFDIVFIIVFVIIFVITIVHPLFLQSYIFILI